jgi:signal transduction histidine kinase
MTLRRLKIALFAAVIVPLVLFAAFASDERRQLLHAAEGEALASAATLREHAINTIETDELLLRQLDRRIQGMGWDEIRSSSDVLSNDIAAMHAGMKQISLMLLTDAEGKVWAGTPPHPGNGFVSASHLDVWSAQREADQGTYFSHPYVGQMTGRVNFGISRRRSTPDGRFDGTVHITFDASYLAAFWSEVIAGKDGAAVALVRTDGDLLARFPEVDGPLPGRISSASDLLSHLALKPLGGVYRTDPSLEGRDRIYAYARVGPHPLVVVYSLGVDSVLAPWRLHLLLFGGFGVLAAAAVASAVLAAIRQAHQVIEQRARRTTNEAVATQGRRLENLGQLAAESAHDFANILQAMSAAATLIRRNAGHPERVRSLTNRLDEDVERGASLTRNMLDLVRSGGGVPSLPANSADPAIDLTDAMARVGNRLRRLLGDAYRLRWDIEPADVPTRLRDDRSELELVIMNLAVNARDAMPNGGEVLIQVTAEQVGAPSGGRQPAGGTNALKPGPYVRLSVIDSGAGMPPDVLARAGEMFFTTKPLGRGTGLGLAGARGFAERAGGRLTIDSKVGRGTTVTLWLPAIEPSPVSSAVRVQPVA